MQIVAPTSFIRANFQQMEGERIIANWTERIVLFELQEDGEIVPLYINKFGQLLDPRDSEYFKSITAYDE